MHPLLVLKGGEESEAALDPDDLGGSFEAGHFELAKLRAPLQEVENTFIGSLSHGVYHHDAAAERYRLADLVAETVIYGISKFFE